MQDKVYRLIDANINRSLEALRVLEDTARFILDDRDLSLKLKNMRHKIKAFSSSAELKKHMLVNRDIRKDVGRGSIASEVGRGGILDVFRSNIKRLEESLRVLEEYSKLIDRRSPKAFKTIRYDVYDIEKEASAKLARRLLMDFDLYVISDKPEVLKKAVMGGAKAVQLRIKDKSRLQVLRAAKKTAGMIKGRATFIVNDDPEIAKVVGADGVHMGQNIGRSKYQKIRKMLGNDKIIGISASDLKGAIKAQVFGADYVGLGPLFETPIKPGIKPLGIKGLRRVMKRVTIPVVAIGGINKDNIDRVVGCGVKKVAVIRAVNGSKSIKKAVKLLIGSMA